MKWRALLLAIAALVGVNRARATTITVKITGTVSSGTDDTNMWGYGINGSMAGATFTATYTFYDAIGSNSTGTNPSSISTPTGSTSSPGTATVTIGLFTYTFGAGTNPASLAEQYNSTPPQVGGYAKYTTTDNISNLEMGITPTAYGLVGNWETAVPSGTAVNAWSNNYFTYSDGANNKSSLAYLTPTSIEVDGVPYGCDVPTSAETTFDQWSSQTPTLAQFTEQLYPIEIDFSGSYVEEFSGGVGTDVCYNNYTDPNAQAFTQISGGTWEVNLSDAWAYDNIGYTPDAVTFYRQHSAVPCGATIYQQMEIYCSVNSTFYPYGPINILNANITSTQIQSSRQGISSGLKTY